MMYNYMDSNSVGISVFFFCMLVIFGSFFAMQLVLAQIMDSFAAQQEEKLSADQKEQEQEEKAEEIARLFVGAAKEVNNSRELEEIQLDDGGNEDGDQSDKPSNGASMQMKTNASGAKIKGNATLVSTL